MTKPRTRLDAVVKVRERDEERALEKLVEARRAAQASQQQLEAARRQALRDERSGGPAFEWDMVELAHRKALTDVRAAEQRVKTATRAESLARDGHVAAHSRAEAVRRVAEARREELIQEQERIERRRTDELAALQYAHRRTPDAE
jgi:flagellar biosynthesis chaperone FliJ